MFATPVLLMRKKQILKKLKESGATTIETAKTFAEAGIFNPNAFSRLNDKLVKDNILRKTKNNKYYINP